MRQIKLLLFLNSYSSFTGENSVVFKETRSNPTAADRINITVLFCYRSGPFS